MLAGSPIIAANVRIINEVFKKGDLHARHFHLPQTYIESTSLSTAIKTPFLKISFNNNVVCRFFPM
jgi:hypothetical protein